jgi:glycyl-tRNA synthetase
MTFQDIILTLQNFWAKKGCLVWLPYHESVGAGTGNSATLLRVLGPESWDVAYVEPSFRPDDGRFGDSPNRMQMHHQFQVIMKPIRENCQELYLESLEALGLNLKQHDVRFVEDNWESPALGAWGLGWEVWLDGMEITQFTYFQQAAGLLLDPTSCEITYGLDRIATYLQGVESVWDLKWNKEIRYADILKQQEIEFCEYAFHTASVPRLRTTYENSMQEAKDCLEKGLVIPAYDYILKCSHLFNLLDTRGAMGLGERVKSFADMRKMTKQIGEAFVQQREALGFPIGIKTMTPVAVTPSQSEKTYSTPQDLYIELGVEEFASSAMGTLREQFEAKLIEQFHAENLAFENIQTYISPLRMVAFVSVLQPQQADRVDEVRGPKKEICDSNPKAFEGFLKKNSLTKDQVTFAERDGNEIAIAQIERKGKSTIEILSTLVPTVLGSLVAPKSMRWRGDVPAMNRPVRSLSILFGETAVSSSFGGVVSSNISRGARFNGLTPVVLSSASSAIETLRRNEIEVDQTSRLEEIRELLIRTAQTEGGTVQIGEELLEEVSFLVEKPVVFVGSVDRRFMSLPAVVLKSVMGKHVRCFPVYESEDKVLPRFIGFRNGGHEGLDLVRSGFERVVSARLRDAEFFITEDEKESFESYRPKLSSLMLHQELGSILDKSDRLVKVVPGVLKLVPEIAKDFDQETLDRSTYLLKVDLATRLVVEMTSLQGEVGAYYAKKSGESEKVQEIIREHLYPKYPGDRIPKSNEAKILAIIDRLDTLAAYFSIGAEPTGSADPFGLRREAIAIISILFLS